MDTPLKGEALQGSPVTGTKRAAPSLLPAFELESSPPLPRPAKRLAREGPSGEPLEYSPSETRSDAAFKYPTPIPTSSTGIFSSSPPQLARSRRPPLQRTASTLSERAPLASVPSVELDVTGEPMLMGRSGQKSHYQLSTNKLISRVHVRARFLAAEGQKPNRVEIVCTGWNGAKVHCQGNMWDLSKDDSFTSESQDNDIMIDVQDSRVLLKWPKISGRKDTPPTTDSSPGSENSPSFRRGNMIRRSPHSSPLRARVRLQSPVSPSPNPLNNLFSSSPVFGGRSANNSLPPVVEVYEDASADEADQGDKMSPTQSTQRLTQPLGVNHDVPQDDEEPGSFSDDANEENDPILTSFGPTGENLLPRMANVRATDTPKRQTVRKDPDDVFAPSSPPNPERLTGSPKDIDITHNPVVNHIINQVAYSRVAGKQLSSILTAIPDEMKTAEAGFGNDYQSLNTLKAFIDRIDCVGEVPRKGKDAAGKQLESEFYYIPEKDFDDTRRDTVNLQKPGRRNCRNAHVVSIVLSFRQ